MRKVFCFVMLALAGLVTDNMALAQVHKTQFKNLVRNKSAEWFATAEAAAVADTVLAYQFPSGGWPKNHQWQLTEDRSELVAAMRGSGVGSTIDNNATSLEMLFLCKMYGATGDVRYRQAFMRGVKYLEEAQYENGGWPQFYPLKPAHKKTGFDYSWRITYNDDAMINVMKLLRDIAKPKAPYDVLNLSAEERAIAKRSFDRGVQCILNTQIKDKDGKLTVWCQQHDEKTLAPANARAFELASYTGCGENVGILELLMDISKPSDSIVNAVTAAVDWLKAHKIEGMVKEKFVNDEGKNDCRLVAKQGAKPLWARYYDLETEKPFYCGRDGIKRANLSDIGYERRNGYRWIDNDVQRVIDKYPTWLAKVKAKRVLDGAKAAGKEAGKEARAAGKEVGKTAQEVGQEMGKAAQKAGKQMGKTAQEVGKGMGKAAKEAGRAIKDTFTK